MKSDLHWKNQTRMEKSGNYNTSSMYYNFCNNNTQCYQLEQKDKLVRNTSLSTDMLAAKGKLKKRFTHCSIGQGTSGKAEMKALGAFFAPVSTGKVCCQSSWLFSPSSRAWGEKCCWGRGALSWKLLQEASERLLNTNCKGTGQCHPEAALSCLWKVIATGGHQDVPDVWEKSKHYTCLEKREHLGVIRLAQYS